MENIIFRFLIAVILIIGLGVYAQFLIKNIPTVEERKKKFTNAFVALGALVAFGLVIKVWLWAYL